jgi:hypothetical protein
LRPPGELLCRRITGELEEQTENDNPIAELARSQTSGCATPALAHEKTPWYR